ncbi:alpha/beta fold hydrolase [Albimonas sp. CAU 1670]|uniref:alpha/beta fold hydrolase n=1 Tax=Albimonas sp. CAU 1670 TaxID=3032599 RepID=UPI0023DC4A75|nr:alpha/beta fold hydrolase [Albimonas sp. CAU 1670]MDF2234189.1 alpha/beta fold hydrolase [Albimonas sp. CAU 1670]
MDMGGATDPRERSWEVDGLRFAGLEWGPERGLPVLALHGWMDHAGSFAELAPRLEGCRVVALDLSGHGLSGHRAAHATYNIWDDLPQIAGLLEQLGWRSCVLVGHSRGAIISGLVAATMPDRVRALVSLDSLAPYPHEADAVETLAAFVEETRKQAARGPRRFVDVEDYVRRRSAQGNSPESSRALAGRALEKTADGFVLRGDSRLFASSAMKLTRPQVEELLRAIRCPVLNIWAEEGSLAARPRSAEIAKLGAELIADYVRADLPGDHHFHMDPEVAGPMADTILDFLRRRLQG